jgi:hypothetical protein
MNNFNLIDINKDFTSKYKSDKVNIGVILEAPYVVKRSIELDGNASNTLDSYDGIFSEIIAEIIKLNPNWDTNITFIPRDKKQEALKEMGDNKYDILIGDFTVNEEANKYASFTKNIFLTKNVLLYKASTDVYEIFFKALMKNLGYPLLIMLLLIIVLGSALNYIDKTRGTLGAYWATTVGMLGEPGLLTEETDGKLYGMMISFVIVISGFYFTMFLQSQTVGEVLDSQNVIDPFVDKTNFSGTKIVMFKSSGSRKFLQKAGATIIDFNKKDLGLKKDDNIFSYFSQTDDEVDGIVATLQGANYWSQEYDNLFISGKELGYKEIVFAVNKNKRSLMNQMNKSIFTLQDNKIIREKCSKYFPNEDYLCDF